MACDSCHCQKLKAKVTTLHLLVGTIYPWWREVCVIF